MLFLIYGLFMVVYVSLILVLFNDDFNRNNQMKVAKKNSDVYMMKRGITVRTSLFFERSIFFITSIWCVDYFDEELNAKGAIVKAVVGRETVDIAFYQDPSQGTEAVDKIIAAYKDHQIYCELCKDCAYTELPSELKERVMFD